VYTTVDFESNKCARGAEERVPELEELIAYLVDFQRADCAGGGREGAEGARRVR
jgi:hypothetical protein